MIPNQAMRVRGVIVVAARPRPSRQPSRYGLGLPSRPGGTRERRTKGPLGRRGQDGIRMRNTSRRELRSRSRDATVEVDSKAGMGPELISGWPGKIIDGHAHPALWHMLDVGAVAACLLARRSLTGDRPADEAAALLVVLHDLGKFSSSLRAMLLGQPHTGLPHWQHSYRLLQDHDDALADVIGAAPGVRRTLYAAAAGHHGGPSQHLESRKHTAQSAQIGAAAHRAAREAIDASTLLLAHPADRLSQSEVRRA